MRLWMGALRIPAGNQHGSIITVVALMMTVLVGFSALTVDAGRLFIERSRLQAVADAGALAGAFLLSEGPAAAELAARETVAANLAEHGLNPAEHRLEIEASSGRLQVRLGRDAQVLLARVLGRERVPVGARAVAVSSAPGAVKGAVPLGVEAGEFELGERYVLKQGSGDGNQQGNFQALALGGTGAAVYRENLRHGFDEWLSAGDEVLTEPGAMTGPTKQGLRERIAADPGATWNHVSVTSPRRLLVPIVESFDVNGRKTVKIIGFALFFLEEVDEDGAVTGRFIGGQVSGRPQSGDEVFDMGLKIVRLVE